MNSTDKTANRLSLRRYWVFSAIGVGLFAVPLCLWLARIPIAESVARQVCNSKELHCNLTIRSLSLDEISAEGIRLDADGADPLSIEKLDLSLNWTGLFAPTVTFISVDKPALTIDATDGRVRIGVLDNFQSGESGGTVNVPPFRVTSGEVVILTDAGPVRGTVNSSGALQREIQSSFVLEPTVLTLDDYELQLEEASADLILAEGRVSGSAEIRLPRASLEMVEVNDLSLQLDIQPGSDQHYDLKWTAAASGLGIETIFATGLASDGRLSLNVDSETLSSESIRLTGIEGVMTSATLDYPGVGLTGLSATISLEEDDEGLVGPVGLSSALMVDEVIAAERAVVSGDLELASGKLVAPTLDFDGAVSLQTARLAETITTPMMSGLNLPSPVDAHGRLFQTSLSQFADGFDAAIEFQASFDQAASAFELRSLRPPSMQNRQTGQALLIRPVSHQDWMTLDETGLIATGNIIYSDARRAIDLRLQEATLALDWSEGDWQLQTGAISLADLPAGERTLAADLSGLDYSVATGQARLSTDGLVRFSGAAFGMEFNALHLTTGLNGLRTGNGWSLRLPGDGCLDASFISARLPAMSLGPARTEACAMDGLLFRRGADGLEGNLALSPLDLTFETDFAEGEFALDEPEVSWQLADAFSLTITGSDFSAPFELPADGASDPRPAELIADGLSASLNTGGEAVAVIFDLADGAFDLEDLPVNLSFDRVSGDGAFTNDGPVIDYTLTDALVEDGLNSSEDSLYQPLLVSGDGQLTASGVTMDGRLRLSGRSTNIGTVNVTHSFSDAKGMARLSGGELVFTQGGLQLHDLTERLRGIAVNASGVLRPSADVLWSGGAMVSTGDVEIEKLSFSTFRLGEFKGLSGVLSFSDLLGLETNGAQTITLDELRFTPTIVLRDGVADVSVLGPQAFYLESAKWPFVGGELGIEPTVWRFDSQQQLIRVTADNWELTRLLGMFQIPDLDVTGRVSGEFPIEIVDANAYFRNARLTAVEDGYIRYDSNITRSAAQADDYAKMAFDALKNFEYRVMSVGANGNLTGNIVIDLALSGRNPDVMDGQVFNLNVNLESELAKLVHAGSISASVQSAQDLVVDLVQQRNQEGSEPVDQND
ncbi:MAG: hypothetical protein CMK07_16760 [Ponticaulis sp.]|nr:hypothetical protein [Ponticaulis sp.]